ncbi:MAG: hypothetical protein MJ065_09835 [Oscillospiraceae bacterium]|nr:hypothetical protein [Oscillospiraceae bacterium]
MNMRAMDKISDMLCEEIEEIASKGTMSMGDLEIVYKATGAVKNIDKIKMSGGNSYGNSYGDGNSYRGRHWVRGHYSMSDGRQEMIDRMQDMMSSRDMSSAERDSFSRAMDALNNY